MRFQDFCKDRVYVLLLNGAALLTLSVYLLLLKNTGAAVFLMDVVWAFVLVTYLLVEYYQRRKYFQELEMLLEELDRRYLMGEVMPESSRLEDRLYREVLRKSNKSVIEAIHSLEDCQKEYREYMESWIHEVKTPVTAIHLICENQKGDTSRRILTELDEIENEVERSLYFARMEQVHQDYLIHPVNLREVVMAAIRGQKRHFIRSGMEIDLDLEETVVSTDEKWVEFILKQIFSNCVKYKREQGARLKIWGEQGKNQKSLFLEDNGTGIPAADLGRIFDKGFTGKNGRTAGSNATGMGLYFCKRLCDKLGIGIACQSEEGVYTRIILTFPDSRHILQK